VKLLLVVLLAVSLPLPALAATPVRVPASELVPGQIGYGLTVFAGSVPDTFGVTVLGVRHAARAGGDIIMVELSGHDLERSAVAQGMSGSPVYLDDGRLMGAVAFGWSGALRPIAGVTPAAELDVARDRRVDVRADAGAVTPFDVTAFAGSSDAARLASALLDVTPTTHRAPGSDGGWPDPAALAHSLLAPPPAAAADGLAPLPMSLFAVPAGAATGAAQTDVAPPMLVPGAACAVALVTGDAQLGAIGTVSLVEGARMVCMAHPFMQLGPVDLPLAAAEVLTVFPSREMSFKMGSSGAVIGRITHDLRGGLAGDLGVMAATTPVTVALDLPSGSRRFAFDVARQPDLTPQLVFWCLYSALLADGDDRSDQTVTYDVTVDLADRDGQPLPAVRLSGVTGGPGGVGALAGDWQMPLQMLLGNRHRPVDVVSVRADLAVRRPLATAEIIGIDAPTVIVPGQTLAVDVRLRERFGPERRERFELAVPPGVEAGLLRLGVASARDIFQLDMLRAAGLFDDRSLEGLIDILNRPRSSGDLVVVLVDPRPGLTAAGRELAGLPPSVARTLAASPPGAVGMTMAGYAARADRSCGLILTGSAVADVLVRRPQPPRTEGDRP
jgi:hypothetical protein